MSDTREVYANMVGIRLSALWLPEPSSQQTFSSPLTERFNRMVVTIWLPNFLSVIQVTGQKVKSGT